MKVSESRSQLYRLFSTYMAFPELGTWEESIRKKRLVLLDGVGRDLPYFCQFDDITIGDVSTLDDLNIVFTNSFDSGTASVSLHGRSYSKDGDQKHFEDLFRFYDHFGLDFEQNRNDFWPDSLQVELEFMHYLTYLEGVSDARGDAVLKAQRDFLGRHLIPFLAGIKESSIGKNMPPYFQLVAMMNEFVDADRAYLNEVVGDRISINQVC